MGQYFSITYTNEHCVHSNDCDCVLTAKGIHQSTIGFEFTSHAKDKQEQLLHISSKIAASIGLKDGQLMSIAAPDTDKQLLEMAIGAKSDVQLVTPPFNYSSCPEPLELVDPDPVVRAGVKAADFAYLKARYDPGNQLYSWDYFEDKVWRESGAITLQSLILKRDSMYHWAFGKTNGRPHAISAMSRLYPEKLAKATTKLIRTQGLPEVAREIIPLIPEALDWLYRAMRIKEFRTQTATISITTLQRMYLGASDGLKTGKNKDFQTEEGIKLKRSHCGKKLEQLEPNLRQFLSSLRTGRMPEVVNNTVPKNEMYFSWSKQYSSESYAAWIEKLRLFIIPSGVFNIMEQLVSKIRMLIERGWVIQIGHKWPHGGADRLAHVLGINKQNCEDDVINEGDYTSLDVSIQEFLTNWYYSFGLIHEKPGTPQYAIKHQILQWVIKQQAVRLQRIFADMWCAVTGEVASGYFNTSHCDSWVTALLFFLFIVVTISTSRITDRERLQEVCLMMVHFICYGDDFLYNMSKYPEIQAYINAHNFKAFLMKFFRMEIRDLKVGIPFVSKIFEGWLSRVGASFLKHYFIINPNHGVGQSWLLPFRESREVLTRAIYGREVKYRDAVDVLLSIIGHAYGTYAANKDCYQRLKLLFFMHYSQDSRRSQGNNGASNSGLIGAEYEEVTFYGCDSRRSSSGISVLGAVAKQEHHRFLISRDSTRGLW